MWTLNSGWEVTVAVNWKFSGRPNDSDVSIELRVFFRGTLGTDALAAFYCRFDRIRSFEPATAAPTDFAAVSAYRREQAPSVKANSPVFQLSFFGASITESVISSAIMPGTPVNRFTVFHLAPHKI